MKIFAGVDEVGRGSLIGPVYAAAVILSSGATGTNHTFRSNGIPGKGQVWPNPEMSKYDGA